MKHFIAKSAILALAVAATACTGDYENINSNPYEPGSLEADGYQMTSVMNAIAGTVISADPNCVQFTDCLLGGDLGGYFADGANFTNSIVRNNAPNNWTRVLLNDKIIIPQLYTNLGTLRRGNDEVAYAVGCIIKVATMHRVADAYGPIPYSQIGADGDIATPYDSQESLYNQFFVDLDSAVNVLKANISLSLSPEVDRVYGGDISKWITYANSLKLRLALRIVNPAPEKARAMAEAAVAAGVMESNADNAAWHNFATINNPFYVVAHYNENNDWGFTTGGDTHAAADIICYMNGYNDPRRAAYFSKSHVDGQEYCGIRRGWETFDKYWGFQCSGVAVKSSDPVQWMNAAEVAFLRAEGAARGWNMGGSAEDFYNKGVALSFEQWGVSGTESYLADDMSIPGAYYDASGVNPWNGALPSVTIKWDEGASFDTKLEKIIVQKWIANWMLGNEAWADIRRTGYPRLIPVAFNGSPVVDVNLGPQRMPYPQEEYTNNAANVQEAVSKYLGGADNLATKLWWAKK